MTLAAALVVDRPGFRLDAVLPDVDGVVAVLGPSGVGKTTLLHALAGLVPARGAVRIDGVDVGGLPTWRRRIGLVFQDVRLLPHLDVRANLAYGAADRAEVLPLAERLGVAALLDRRPGTLSGGEARRVALARTLLARPRALLLDEPLVGLDPARRADLLAWLREAVRDAGLPTLWVTHDTAEAQAVADRVIALGREDGVVRVRADGDVPSLLAAGGLGLGLANALDVDAVEAVEGGARGRWAGVELCLPPAPPAVAAAGRGRVLLAPEEPILARDDPGATSARNVLDGVVVDVAAGDDGPTVSLAVGDGHLAVAVTAGAVDALGLAPGTRVRVLVKARALRWTR